MNESLKGQRIVVTGASGLIGSSLASALQHAGCSVIRGVRRPARDAGEMYWNPDAGEIESGKFEGASAVVHLAGENISAHRWTESFKQKILHSRTQGTLLVSEAIAHAAAKPRALICASAIGFYGDRGDELLTEASSAGGDFLANVCQQWEAATRPARDAGVRVVNVRTGVVLSAADGALAKMVTPFKLGLGGAIGSGRQYMGWVALEDVVGAIEFALGNLAISGPVNVTAPNPVTNAEFTKTLGRILSRPTLLPMPAFAARLAFGEMADALLLSSTRAMPQALVDAGFRFRYPELEPALRHILGR